MTGENEKTTMLQGRGISKYYGAKQQRRQVLRGENMAESIGAMIDRLVDTVCDEAAHGETYPEAWNLDQLTLRRLKKQKLSLKDQIVKIEDQLIPDIIA